MKLAHGLHLAYCTNIHRGESWADILAGLEAAIASFKKQFVTAAGHQLINDEPVAALDKDEVDPTKITVVKK